MTMIEQTETTGDTMPTCPYCGASWSAAMLAAYDSFTGSTGCACCGGPSHDIAPTATPTADLCCDACHKPIFTVVRDA